MAGKDLFKWIHEEDPEAVCAMAGLCDPSAKLTPLTPPLHAAASKLLAIRDDDQCNTCQLVMAEAASALSDPVSDCSGPNGIVRDEKTRRGGVCKCPATPASWSWRGLHVLSGAEFPI